MQYRCYPAGGSSHNWLRESSARPGDEAMIGRRVRGLPKEGVDHFDTTPPPHPPPKLTSSEIIQHTNAVTSNTDLRPWRLDFRPWFPTWALYIWPSRFPPSKPQFSTVAIVTSHPVWRLEILLELFSLIPPCTRCPTT
ncbi:hypothetical protein BDV93DRAFT_515078 [Ceratobasidium sp. AG-I]|nr:hypothetical protein BDV93DRAFT_515078 [Ceratobasidium sp. AG-I]